MKYDPIKLTNAGPQRVADASYSIISAIQNYTIEERMLAAACHLKLLCEMMRASPQDVMTPADSLMASPEGQYRRIEFRAARDYMENEK